MLDMLADICPAALIKLDKLRLRKPNSSNLGKQQIYRK